MVYDLEEATGVDENFFPNNPGNGEQPLLCLGWSNFDGNL